MIQEFQKVLRTPKPQLHSLTHLQNLIVQTLSQTFSEDFDINDVQYILQEIRGFSFPKAQQVPLTLEQEITLNYKLVEYLIALMKTKLVSIETYKLLEEQTQKSQSTIRSHIKIEQEMKMYLDYLEAQINKMQKHIVADGGIEGLKRELCIVQNRESLLHKEKVGLIKKNQKLKCEVEILQSQIQKLKSSKNSKDSLVKSIISRTITEEDDDIPMIPKQMRSSQVNAHNSGMVKMSSRTEYDKNKEKEKQKERENFKMVQNHELTQKKKTVYFPSPI